MTLCPPLKSKITTPCHYFYECGGCDFLDLDDDGDEEESMKSAAKDADDDDNDPEPEKWNASKLTKDKDLPKPYKYDPYGDEDDDDGDYYMDEAAKPDFLDLDGDGNETESMKSAAADSTPHGNYVNKARAKSSLTKKDCHVYGHDSSGKATKLNSTSDVDNPKYKKFTIKTESLAESFKKRMIGNLKGSEYILSETFKRK